MHLMPMTERDWKHFRQLHALALERYSEKILKEVSAACQKKGKTHHENYVTVYKMIKSRDRDMANAFNDLRRSTADMQLAIMYRLGVIYPDDLEPFSEQARATLRSFLGE